METALEFIVLRSVGRVTPNQDDHTTEAYLRSVAYGTNFLLPRQYCNHSVAAVF